MFSQTYEFHHVDVPDCQSGAFAAELKNNIASEINEYLQEVCRASLF